MNLTSPLKTLRTRLLWGITQQPMKMTTPGAQKNTNPAADGDRESSLTTLFINNIGYVEEAFELVWQMPLLDCWGSPPH